MPKNKSTITSSNYKSTFYESAKTGNGVLGSFVIVGLLSVFTGLVGYYVGDRGLVKNVKIPVFQKQTGAEITEYTPEQLSQKINSSAYDLNLYNQIIANLKDKYVDSSKVDDQKLFDGSLKGMVESVGDKATSYFNPQEYKEFQESFSGQFEGIGVRMEYQNNQIVVAEIIPNTPAAEKGVKVGYVFYKVDGKDISTSTIEEVVSKVRGKAGTTVKVAFYDPETKDTVEKELQRAAIKVDAMRIVEKNPDTAVFEISRFTEDTLDQWKALWDQNVKQIQAKNYKNIVIDLRGDGGGFLDAAIYAANDFMDPGKTVVTERSKVSGDKQNVTSNPNPRLKGKNVVILINGGTASASEILTGALTYNNKYKVYGTKSFGKGTVQNTYNLPNGGALKITTEYWVLPNGKRLDNDNPITPDVEVKVNADAVKAGKDNVLEEAMKEFIK